MIANDLSNFTLLLIVIWTVATVVVTCGSTIVDFINYIKNKLD